MASKGYVVRGKDADGIDVYADEDEDADVQCNPDEGTMLVGDERFSALDAAAGLRAEMIRLGCTDVAIYQVHDDGHEGRLPSYEEALGEIERLRGEIGEAHDAIFEASPQVSAPLAAQIRSLVADLTASADNPLAALEAAEHRLLEAGGWTEEGPDKWSLEGVTWDRRDAVGIARYHAAKGGA